MGGVRPKRSRVDDAPVFETPRFGHLRKREFQKSLQESRENTAPEQSGPKQRTWKSFWKGETVNEGSHEDLTDDEEEEAESSDDHSDDETQSVDVDKKRKPGGHGFLKAIGGFLLGVGKQTDEKDDESEETNNLSPAVENNNTTPSPLSGIAIKPPTVDVHEIDGVSGMPAFKSLPNVSSATLGASIVAVSDEFSGRAENLLKDSAPDKTKIKDIFSYTVDAWETRRRRIPGHDWVLIRLAGPSQIAGVELDTSNLSSAAPRVSIEQGSFETELLDLLNDSLKNELQNINVTSLADLPSTFQSVSRYAPFLAKLYAALDSENWIELLPMTKLRRYNPDNTSNVHQFIVSPAHSKASQPVQFVRVNIYPDGGLSRVRIYGQIVRPSPSENLPLNVGAPLSPQIGDTERTVDVASAIVGGWPVAVSSLHSDGLHNLLAPGAPTIDSVFRTGWQWLRPPIISQKSDGCPVFTGEEFIVLRLAYRAVVHRVEIDTSPCLGDAPSCVTILAADLPFLQDLSLLEQIEYFKSSTADRSIPWISVTKDAPILPTAVNSYTLEALTDETDYRTKSEVSVPRPARNNRGKNITSVQAARRFSHFKIVLVPDGAIGRIRIFGNPLESLCPPKQFPGVAINEKSENVFLRGVLVNSIRRGNRLVHK